MENIERQLREFGDMYQHFDWGRINTKFEEIFHRVAQENIILWSFLIMLLCLYAGYKCINLIWQWVVYLVLVISIGYTIVNIDVGYK